LTLAESKTVVNRDVEVDDVQGVLFTQVLYTAVGQAVTLRMTISSIILFEALK
jgi:hypothetical protein